jgi:hypothetical protein
MRPSAPKKKDATIFMPSGERILSRDKQIDIIAALSEGMSI